MAFGHQLSNLGKIFSWQMALGTLSKQVTE